MSYVAEKIFWKAVESEVPEVVEVSSGFSTVKFVAIAGGIASILFGLGYVLYGLGSSLVPAAKIIDELHDSGKSSDESDKSDDDKSDDDKSDDDKSDDEKSEESENAEESDDSN